MNKDLLNEINNYRGNMLAHFADNRITASVKAALEQLDPEAINGLQGISAEDDGVTKTLWTQAVTAAEMDGSLTFPQYRNSGDEIPEDADPVSFGIATNVVAGRVARAIMIVNGMVTGFGPMYDDRWETH